MLNFIVVTGIPKTNGSIRMGCGKNITVFKTFDRLPPLGTTKQKLGALRSFLFQAQPSLAIDGGQCDFVHKRVNE